MLSAGVKTAEFSTKQGLMIFVLFIAVGITWGLLQYAPELSGFGPLVLPVGGLLLWAAFVAIMRPPKVKGSNDPRKGNIVSPVFAWCLVCGLATVGVSWAVIETGGHPSGGAKTSDPSNVAPMSWESVAAVFKGAPNTSVEPYDSTAPNTMRVILSGSVAREISAYDARKLATTARSRLGNAAIVYVKDDTGKTLAKAAPWGVE